MFLLFAMRMILRQQKPNGRRAWRNLKKALSDGDMSPIEWQRIGADLALFEMPQSESSKARGIRARAQEVTNERRERRTEGLIDG